MGFTLRFLLGLLLISICCLPSNGSQLSRQVRQININGDKPAEKLQKIENEKKGETTSLKTLESDKPKTDVSTEKTILNNVKNVKMHKSEPYNHNKKSDSGKVSPDEIARAIDINKYISKEFHNKNNVYSLPISPDTEKFVNSDYEYHSTTKKDLDSSHYFETELTTPKSIIFDKKFKEAVDSVDQKLEQIDHSSDDVAEETSEDVNIDKLYEQTKNNDTQANLKYINYKSIISNDTSKKNSLHKDLVLEAGTNLDFNSSFNKTSITDDETDSGNNTIVKEPVSKIESSTVRHLVTTAKSVVLTKPTSNQNSSHISLLNNKIERERLKNIDPIPSNSIISTEKTIIETDNSSLPSTVRNQIDITKRGSIKFADYASTSTQPTSNTKKNKQPAHDVMVQENQIVQVQVEPPKNFDKTPQTTTIKFESTPENFTSKIESNTEEIKTSTIPKVKASTPEIEITTTFSSSEKVTTDSDLEVVTLDPNPSTRELFTVETTTSYDSTEETTATTENTISTTDYDINSTSTDDSKRTSKGLVFETTTASTVENVTTPEFVTSTVPTTSEVITTMNNTQVGLDTTETTTEELPTSTIDFRDLLTESTTESLDLTTSIVYRISKPSDNETVTKQSILTSSAPIEETTTTFDKNTTLTDIGIYHIETIDNQTTLRPDLYRPEQKYPKVYIETTTENSTTTPEEINQPDDGDDNSGTIAAITISSIGAVCLVLLAGLLVIMRKRQKRFNYGQRCRPVSLDDYSMDNISVQNSVRRKGMMRSSKRSYGNPAFEDPSSVTHPLNFPALSKFATNIEEMKAEFEEIPQITAKTNELPEGCDTKNRYANVIPLPETRVFLKQIEGYPNSDYINANYVTGPKNTKGYYIACQAPMQNTVDDFWRMIWEQQCKVILMLTQLFENGIEKCYDYLPPSEVLDNHRLFGDFQITLKKREVKDKYIISSIQLKNMVSNSWREVTHFWYIGWPEKGVPTEANSMIAFLIEARSHMKTSSIDRKEVTNGDMKNGSTKHTEINPVVVHCSPGTGRTGAVIACDIAIREFEQSRIVDIPRIVYKIRRDRASSVQTKDQYAFIYKVVSLYATKLTGGAFDSL